MCFTVPYKVIEITNTDAILEGGKHIRLDKHLPIKKGDYIRVSGDVIVDTMSKADGEKVVNLIQSLSTPYEETT